MSAALAASPFESRGRLPPSVAAEAAAPVASPAAAAVEPAGSQHLLQSGGVTHDLTSGVDVWAAPWNNDCVLFGQATLPGTRYGNLNQDYAVTQQLHEPKQLRQHRWPQCYVTVVLDGHGMLGEAAAQEAGSHIMHSIKHSQLRHRQLSELSRSEVEQLVQQAFEAGHAAALRVFDDAPHAYIFPIGSRYEQRYTLQIHPGGDKSYYSPGVGNRMLEFGTTATLALVQGTTVVVADVGDSLAVLGWEQGDSYEADIVSVRHFGWEPGERERLQKQCGDTVSVSEEDGYLSVEVGRLRGFQLAMTRALGHRLLSQFGVDSAPSVTFHQLQPQHVCLIVATDGVWEVLSPSEAVKLVCDVVAEGGSAELAAWELSREAVRLATSVRNAGEADNTTVSVFVFSEL